ncbi:protein ALP1-like [Xenia sp. Carnegie-2017]|uniref:protein ALP1-like n=1 Tax=Xenia sp. Carnegie-2017 TaxID=2897299 RepID=UPI001F0419E2|nr:protein ALP1-like [Xenia sp. Carnegie-2017]
MAAAACETYDSDSDSCEENSSSSEDNSYSSEDEEILLLLLLLRQRRRRLRAKKRKIWTKKWILRRESQGAFTNLIREINVEDPEKFRQYHRVERRSFEEILGIVSPHIEKKDTQLRASIKPSERLSVTLRFLATGESFRSLSFQYRIGERTISGIVEDTCKALYATPGKEEDCLKIVGDFESKWNYPCCIGAIDGKHISIQQPTASGSEFFNYKHYFSVILLALVDANYKFIYVDVGAAGRSGDAGVFRDSALKRALSSNILNLPSPQNVQGIATKIHCHIVGDDAFPMSTNLMKPYPHRNLEKGKRIFNYRLSRARRVVENAFGIFAHRWRVFLTTIKLTPDKITDIILAACCLHNYMINKNKATYTVAVDQENADHTISPGT